MRKFLIYIIASIMLFTSCSKEDKETDNHHHSPIGKIVKNSLENKSYEAAKIAIYKREAYVTTYGHRDICTSSAVSLANEFSGTFFFLNGNNWYINVQPGQAVIALNRTFPVL